MKKANLIFIMVGIILSGCTNYNSQFDCPAGQGIGCKPIDEIDKLIEEQDLSKQEETTLQEKKSMPSKIFEERNSRHRNKGAYQGIYLNRLPEKTQKVLFSGYEDAEGNFHGPKYVYLLIEESRWAGN